MGRVPKIKRVSSFLEIVLCATLLVAGLFTLQDGIASKSTGGVAVLILGAVLITLAAISLVHAIRSLLWHRYMLQVSKPGPATSEYDQ
jgi:membrane protein implicated in regulation of membrane protease activity